MNFDYFPRTFVTNLDKDVERLEKTNRRFERLGLEFEREPAQTYDGSCVTEDCKPAHFGAARTHLSILNKIKESGVPRALIFEDDVVMRDDVHAWMEKIVPQLDSLPWDVFYLGVDLVLDGGMVTANLGRVMRGYHAHAYAVAQKALPYMTEWVERRIAATDGVFDGYDIRTLHKFYSRPLLATQEPNYSYTIDRMVDRNDQYFRFFDRADFEANCEEMRSWSAPAGQVP
jgi:GR25 family glycosyltransferase involved in LPS biosynthesis